MTGKIIVEPLGSLARLSNFTLVPVMRWAAGKGAWSDEPQMTHFWNNRSLSTHEIECLNPEMFYSGEPDLTAIKQGWCRFHLPRYGGWKEFYVLAPNIENFDQEFWSVGWFGEKTAGISRVPICKVNTFCGGCHYMTRVLRSRELVDFFGISSTGEQIPLKKIGEGRIGCRREFGNIALR